MADMANVLGPVPQPQLQAVDAIEEIYTCNRMMLAALPPELLKVGRAVRHGAPSTYSVHGAVRGWCTGQRTRRCMVQRMGRCVWQRKGRCMGQHIGVAWARAWGLTWWRAGHRRVLVALVDGQMAVQHVGAKLINRRKHPPQVWPACGHSHVGGAGMEVCVVRSEAHPLPDTSSTSVARMRAQPRRGC
eukprot:360557-Chlamydomonas_euryale.AAC.1